MVRERRNKTNASKTTKQVGGLAQKTKVKSKPARPETRTQTKELQNTTAKMEKNGFHEVECARRITRHTNQSTLHRKQVGITLTTGKTQTGLRTIGEQICWMTRLGNKRHDWRCCRNLHKDSLNLCKVGSIPLRKGLSMCGFCQLVTRCCKTHMNEERDGTSTSSRMVAAGWSPKMNQNLSNCWNNKCEKHWNQNVDRKMSQWLEM